MLSRVQWLPHHNMVILIKQAIGDDAPSVFSVNSRELLVSPLLCVCSFLALNGYEPLILKSAMPEPRWQMIFFSPGPRSGGHSTAKDKLVSLGPDEEFRPLGAGAMIEI